MNLARFDLVTLGLFVAVARAGSISAGARETNLAIGAASKRISDLEAALQMPLLTRYAFGVELTPAGQICLQHAQHLVEEVGRMNAAITDLAKGMHGAVRLSVCPSVLAQFLPADLERFVGRYPGIRVEFGEYNSATVVRRLVENRTDLGLFVAQNALPENLVAHPYRKDRLHLVLRPDHPLARSREIAFAAARDYPFVDLGSDTTLSQLLYRQSAMLDRPLRIPYRAGSFGSLFEIVRMADALAVVPGGVAEKLGPDYGLHRVPLVDVWAQRQLMAALRAGDSAHPLIQPLLASLVEPGG